MGGGVKSPISDIHGISPIARANYSPFFSADNVNGDIIANVVQTPRWNIICADSSSQQPPPLYLRKAKIYKEEKKW